MRVMIITTTAITTKTGTNTATTMVVVLLEPPSPLLTPRFPWLGTNADKSVIRHQLEWKCTGWNAKSVKDAGKTEKSER